MAVENKESMLDVVLKQMKAENRVRKLIQRFRSYFWPACT